MRNVTEVQQQALGFIYPTPSSFLFMSISLSVPPRSEYMIVMSFFVTPTPPPLCPTRSRHVQTDSTRSPPTSTTQEWQSMGPFLSPSFPFSYFCSHVGF
jgi:hypothetical protein